MCTLVFISVPEIAFQIFALFFFGSSLTLSVFVDQRPKVCIVGGGFGGLYTALRLESLIWPDGKKPQVSFFILHEFFNPFRLVILSSL